MSDESSRFEVFIADKANADRENIVFRLVGLLGPEAATAWEKGILEAVGDLTGFPGPFQTLSMKPKVRLLVVL